MMKRTLVVLTAIAACVGLLAPRALAWGIGTHTYIAGELVGKGAGRSLEQAYGACVPDVFNFVPGVNPFRPGGPYDILHGATAGSDLIGDWTAAAETDRECATAFGYLSHAAPGCADEGAHGIPIGTGYAPAMARALYPYYAGYFNALGIPPPTALFFCEVVVEHAIDLMLAEADRGLGGRMTAAAASRGKGVPALLAEVFGDEFAEYGGGPFLMESEARYREFVMEYGRILSLPPPAAQGVMAAFLAMSGLDMLGIPPQAPGYEQTLTQFTILGDSMLATSKLICASSAPVVLDGVIGATGEALDGAGVGTGSRRNR